MEDKKKTIETEEQEVNETKEQEVKEEISEEKEEKTEEVVSKEEKKEETKAEEPEKKEEKKEEDKKVETKVIIVEKQPKKKRLRNLFWLIIDALIILVVAYFVVGYFNFFKISKNEEPVFAGTVSTYPKHHGNVTVHDYTIYKIVEYEIPNHTISYSMKLWFMEDVK